MPVASSVVVFGAGLSLSITPAKLGELVKSYLLREMHDVPAPRTAPIVVAERVTDLIALLCLAVVGVAAYGVGSDARDRRGRADRASGSCCSRGRARPAR